MKQEPKIVLDTNVWISALLWGGKPAEIIRAAENHRVNILISEEIVGEISRVLAYPKLKKAYQTKDLSHEEFIELVLKIGKLIKVTKKFDAFQEHPADNKFIECAFAGKAKYLVSGDKHLLNLMNYQKFKILTPSDFLSAIKA